MSETTIRRPRVGMLYRPAYHDALLAARDRIEAVEILVDDFLDDTRDQRAILAELGAVFTLVPHALDASIASADGVDERYLRRVARVVERTGSAFWGDHLAFTRIGDRRIPGLAPPARTREQLDVVARNVERANAIVGVRMILENVACPVAFPGAEMSEAEFLRALLDRVDCDLLFDVHNAHANAVNFGDDPVALVDALPPERIRQLHLAGGSLRGGVLVDSHTAPVPEPVWSLLAHLLRRAAPEAITIEREDPLPPFAEALADAERLRRVVADAYGAIAP